MKIRQGFVSNSSSSSFIILGKEIKITDVTSKMIKNKKIMVLGDTLGDGQEVFQIKTIEELAFVKALEKVGYDDIDPFLFIDAFVVGDGDDYGGEFEASLLPKTGKIQYYTGAKDYNSVEDIQHLKQRYDEYGKVSQAMQQFLRAKKIKKIESNGTSSNND